MVHDVDYPDVQRPATRGDCAEGLRPCPFISCKYHLFLDVGISGSVKLNFSDSDLSTLTETCSLDVADRGETTLDIIGGLMNVTRERARQIEARALQKVGPRLVPLLKDTVLTPPGMGPASPTRGMLQSLRELVFRVPAAPTRHMLHALRDLVFAA